MTEYDLWLKFRRLCPSAFRIENSIASGTPDVCAPSRYGWIWIELKILHGVAMYFRNAQLAVLAENSKLPDHLHHHVLVMSRGEICQRYTSKEIIDLHKEPSNKPKVTKVFPDYTKTFSRLDLTLGEINVYMRNKA